MNWRKILGSWEETVEELSLRLQEARIKSSIKDFYTYRKEMNEIIAKYDYPRVKEDAQERADSLMGFSIEQAINAALGHSNKRHIHICWEGRED